MTRMTRFGMFLPIVVSLGIYLNASADVDPVTGEMVGDAAAASFAEYCRAELPADRRAKFDAELRQAEQFLLNDNLPEAERAFGAAFEAADRGGADNDVAVKCLGETPARRWHWAQLALYRLRAELQRDSRVGFDALYVTAADDGADGIIAAINEQPPAGFRQAVASLESIIRETEAERQFGAFILTEEEEIEKASRAALGPLRQRADEEHRAALAAEETAFTRPITDQEIAAAQSLGSIEAIAGAVAGVEVDVAEQKETLVMLRRVAESQEYLRTARDWNLDREAELTERPSSRRAGKRGETLLARATDSSLSLGARDEFYRDAEQYFTFGGFGDQAATAAQQRAAIQAALQTERDRQQAAMEQARIEMDRRAESVQDAIDDMQKTEAEKQSFMEEADALEAELDF